jgi:hypothetical protein
MDKEYQEPQTPIVSLVAKLRITQYQTLRIKGKVKDRNVVSSMIPIILINLWMQSLGHP